MIRRRTFLAAALAAGLSSAPKVTGAARPFEGESLVIGAYSGPTQKFFEQWFVPQFERRTGAKVAVSYYWWEGIPNLVASLPGPAPYDLMVTDPTQGYPAILGYVAPGGPEQDRKAGGQSLFAKIDWANVPNVKRLHPAVVDNFVVREGYGVTLAGSGMALVVHRDVTPQVASWGDLLRPDLAGKVGLYDSLYMSLFTFAAMKAAAEGKAGRAHELVAADLDGVLAFARANRDRVAYWWPNSAKAQEQLVMKGFLAGNMHTQAAANLLREEQPVRVVTPAEDRAYVQYVWAIPRTSAKKRLAEAALDFLLAPESQRALATVGLQNVGILEVAREVAAEDPSWAAAYPHTDEEYRTLRYYPYDVYLQDAATWARLNRFWEREVLRKGF
ncbi:MAG TPA: extracellular solute-binding protein [Thermodesulfobacteriota bacterium]